MIRPLIFLTLLLLVCLSCASAEDTFRLQPSCGPNDVQFEVRPAKIATENPAPDKAHVYIIELFRKPLFEMRDITMRVGLDGSWIGAVRRNLYISTLVSPGEHHLCVQWQSTFKSYTKIGAFASFTANADQQYYFRIEMLYPGGLKLEKIDPDEAKFLLSRCKCKLATSTPKHSSE